MTTADSTTKCNSGELSLGVEEHFIRSSVSQRFSWPMIEPVHDEVNLSISDRSELKSRCDLALGIR